MNEIVKKEQMLFENICKIIDDARQNLAVAANSALTLMYWYIGDNVNKYILNAKRAEYGKQIVSALSTQLTERYGKDFTTRNLHRMILTFYGGITIEGCSCS